MIVPSLNESSVIELITSITGAIILEEIISSKQELKSLVEAVEVRLSLKIEDLYRKLYKVEAENLHLFNKIENIERKANENNCDFWT